MGERVAFLAVRFRFAPRIVDRTFLFPPSTHLHQAADSIGRNPYLVNLARFVANWRAKIRTFVWNEQR